MNQKLNPLMMRWKLTKMTNPKKRLVYTLCTAIGPGTNKPTQGDNLTHLLLAEPVSVSFVQLHATGI